MEKEHQIAMKLDLAQIFFHHLDRMSETSGKISENAQQATNFKMQVLLLESMLWPYIVKEGQMDYASKIVGWEELKKERGNLTSKLERDRLGEAGVEKKEVILDLRESLLKMKGLMGFAVKQNIAPGYKPPEKKYGVKMGTQKASKMDVADMMERVVDHG